MNSFTWAPDSKRLFFTVTDRGRQAIQYIGIEGGGARIAVTGNNTLDDMQFTADGKTIVFTRQSGERALSRSARRTVMSERRPNGDPAYPYQ